MIDNRGGKPPFLTCHFLTIEEKNFGLIQEQEKKDLSKQIAGQEGS